MIARLRYALTVVGDIAKIICPASERSLRSMIWRALAARGVICWRRGGHEYGDVVLTDTLGERHFVAKGLYCGLCLARRED